MRVFGSTTRVTQVSFDNVNIAAELQEPAKVLRHLGDTSTSQISGSKRVASVATSGVLVAASGVVCDNSLFSSEIAVSTKVLTSDGTLKKTSLSLIKQVALVLACKPGSLMWRMSVELTRVTQIELPNTLWISGGYVLYRNNPKLISTKEVTEALIQIWHGKVCELAQMHGLELNSYLTKNDMKMHLSSNSNDISQIHCKM